MKKLILLIILIPLTHILKGQESPSYNFTLDHIALSVADVDRAAEFCADVLKLREITNRSKLDGVRWFSLGPQRELHLISIVKDRVTTNKAIHLALATSSFDAFIKNLDARGIAYTDWPGNSHKVNIRADGIKQVFFQGFDDYWFEVNSLNTSGNIDNK